MIPLNNRKSLFNQTLHTFRQYSMFISCAGVKLVVVEEAGIISELFHASVLLKKFAYQVANH